MGRSLECLLFFLLAASTASAKKLIAFGDSITDNGNGTNLIVQAYYSQLLNQPVTAVRLHHLPEQISTFAIRAEFCWWLTSCKHQSPAFLHLCKRTRARPWTAQGPLGAPNVEHGTVLDGEH